MTRYIAKICHSISDCNQIYTSVCNNTALQCGYGHENDMLGTSIFEIKTPVVESAPFIQRGNIRVTSNMRSIATIDISMYEDGLKCAYAVKSPLISSKGEVNIYTQNFLRL